MLKKLAIIGTAAVMLMSILMHTTTPDSSKTVPPVQKTSVPIVEKVVSSGLTVAVPVSVSTEDFLGYTARQHKDLALAKKLLKSYIKKYPMLAGSTVSFGNAHDYQAVSYYSSGRIVISHTHVASVERIMAHEIWHIIDWRDNAKIDWGESVPPKNVADYVGRML